MGNILNILILFGALQGFLSCFLLLTNQKKTPSKKGLIFLILIFSLACLNMYLFQTLPAEMPFWFVIVESIIPLIIIMPAGPLVYFYIQSLIEADFQWKKVDKRHFYPIILDLLFSIVALIFWTGWLIGLIEIDRVGEMYVWSEVYNKYVDIPRWISLSTYLFLAFRYLKSKELATKNLAWPRRFLWAFVIFQLLWLAHLIPYLIPGASNWLLKNVGWYPVYIPLMVLVYWLGINAYREILLAKNSSITIQGDEFSDILQKVEQVLISEKGFLEPEMNLSQLVNLTGIPQKKLSALFNQHLNKGFKTYLNELRIEAVKEKLLDPQLQHLTITGIALDCGFNSQATFQRTFKAIVGESPSIFRKNSSQN